MLPFQINTVNTNVFSSFLIPFSLALIKFVCNKTKVDEYKNNANRRTESKEGKQRKLSEKKEDKVYKTK